MSPQPSRTFKQGDDIILWGRPEADLILLFGEGRFEATTFINGDYVPTVKLTTNHIVHVHFNGVWVGHKDNVVATCKAFKGDIIEWDLQRYLNGDRPTREQRVLGGNAATLPPPKTATDKLMYLKREIEVEESKKKLHHAAIEASDKVIAAKRLELATLKNAVLAELAAIDPDIMAMAVANAQAAVAPPAPVEPPRVPYTLPPPEMRISTLREVDDHHKLATED